jgi:tripartite-type tricarboxylate transporter receptor subunit TctC
MKTLCLKVALAVIALTLTTSFAHAEWPNDQPIRLIVGFAPGGGTDLIARAIASSLQQELGANVIVDNRPGAAGEIAYIALSRAKPDGYTLAILNTPGFLSIQVQRKVGFDPNSIKPIARIGEDQTAIFVRASSEIRTLNDLVNAAKAKPGEVSYGSAGIGTDTHLAMVMVGAQTGAIFNHIPFKGSAEARVAVLASEIAAGGMNVGEFVGIDSTGLRLIGHFGTKRSPLAPDVPTAKESGIDVVMIPERGIAAPRNLPNDITQKLSNALKRVVESPQFQERAKQISLSLAYLPGPEWESQMRPRLKSFQTLWAQAPWGER